MNFLIHYQTLLMGISLMPIAHCLGRIFLFRFKFSSQGWQGLAFQAFGLGVLSFIILGLGLAGLWQPKVLWILYWILLGGSAFVIFEWWQWLSTLRQEALGERRPSDIILFLLGGLYLTLLYLVALAPEIGGDPLTYHLGTPKEFLRLGQLTYIPDDLNSTFPFFFQMLYLFALGLQGTILAKLIHLQTGLLLWATLFLLLKRTGVTKPFFWSFLFMFDPQKRIESRDKQDFR